MSEQVVPVWSKIPLAQGSGPDDIPDLTIYRPEKATGAALVICPGGGYIEKVAHEKEPVARWLVARGITAFLLSYRVGPRYHHPAPWLDAAESIRLVRARSQEFGIDPQRIGIIGFSAGGHLGAHVSVTFDTPRLDEVSEWPTISSRPDLAVLVYPVIDYTGPYAPSSRGQRLLGPNASDDLLAEVSLSRHVSSQTPPAFLVHSTLDTMVLCQHSMAFAQALRDHDVPVELHLYERGGHGFGGSPMAPEDPVLATWLDHLEAWLRVRGFC
jgi:acetyl esterase/lipase